MPHLGTHAPSCRIHALRGSTKATIVQLAGDFCERLHRVQLSHELVLALNGGRWQQERVPWLCIRAMGFEVGGRRRECLQSNAQTFNQSPSVPLSVSSMVEVALSGGTC